MPGDVVERAEGQRRDEVVAPADQRACAFDAGEERSQDGRLAHAGLARDGDDPAVAAGRVEQRGVEQGERLLALQHRLAGRPAVAGRDAAPSHHRCHELVAAAVHRADHALLAPVVAERSPRRLHPRRERGLRHEARTPDLLEQLRLRHDAVAMRDEVAHDVEHLRLDVHAGAGAADLVRVDVKLDVPEPQHHGRERYGSRRAPAPRMPSSGTAVRTPAVALLGVGTHAVDHPHG